MSDGMLEKSIDEIDGQGNVADPRTNLTRRVAEARGKPIKDLMTDELCTLLRQRMGGTIALALGLFIVSEEPLICGDVGSGDLLQLTLEYDWSDWLATQQYGTDPWISMSTADSTVSGLRQSISEWEKLYAKMELASRA